jgi:DeoR/GlpR family transcriptional regulator of sugar metabolism
MAQRVAGHGPARHQLAGRTQPAHPHPRRRREPAAAEAREFPLTSETFQNNIQCYAERKRAIARHAAGMCTDGETIIINGGTTTFMMAEFLADRHLKILTNSFLMAERLLVSSENEIILPGGKVYREQNVILSPSTTTSPSITTPARCS